MTILVLTPALNEEKTLPKTYASLKSQTFKDWAWVISDNNSSDRTSELLQEFANDSRVQFVRQRSTVSAEKNWQSLVDLARQSKAELVMFLAGDDWLPNDGVLSHYYEALKLKSSGLAMGQVFARESLEADEKLIFEPYSMEEWESEQIVDAFFDDWGWTHLMYACFVKDTFFETFNPGGKRLPRECDWPIALGAALRLRHDMVPLPYPCLVRQLSTYSVSASYQRQRGMRIRVVSPFWALVTVQIRKLVWPWLIYLPLGLRFFETFRVLYVATIFRLWLKNCRRLLVSILGLLNRRVS